MASRSAGARSPASPPIPDKPGQLYAVTDSALWRRSRRSSRSTRPQTPAVIIDKPAVTRDGAAAQKLDIEGIATDGEGGFWLASEGNSDKLVPHALFT